MLINARNILTILLGWFQRVYFLVLPTSFCHPQPLPHHRPPCPALPLSSLLIAPAPPPAPEPGSSPRCKGPGDTLSLFLPAALLTSALSLTHLRPFFSPLQKE